MAKIDSNFKFEIYKMLHQPIRDRDQKDGGKFLERFILPMQRQFENAFQKIKTLGTFYDPTQTPQPRFLKDIVGFTSELDRITSRITDDDLRKLIALAVPLWKEKGLEVGFTNILKLLTGKGSRTFNWFDYRLIVGESSIGEEQQGQDCWLISPIDVRGSTPSGKVVSLLTFKKHLQDRSRLRNHATLHGQGEFYSLRPLQSDNFYFHLQDGVIRIPKTVAFDLSGSFTIEMSLRTSLAQDQVIFSVGGESIEIRYNSLANELSYHLFDGTERVSETLTSTQDLDDNAFRHLALVVDRDKGISRLYLDGVESTTGVHLGGLADLTSRADVFLGGSGIEGTTFSGDFDIFQMSLNPRFDVSEATHLVPGTFVEFIEPKLDEFFADVRLVDRGDLDRPLALDILNLMRPISERLRIIYINAFENFVNAKGDLVSRGSGTPYTLDGNLVLPERTLEVLETKGASEFQNIVLQTRVQVTQGHTYGLCFLLQDDRHYYNFRMRTDNQTFEIFRTSGGVSTYLARPVFRRIFNNTFYVLSVNTDFDPGSGQMLIRCMMDRNVIFEVWDDAFSKGTWGVATSRGTEAMLSEIEMFEMPLELDLILPNFAA